MNTQLPKGRALADLLTRLVNAKIDKGAARSKSEIARALGIQNPSLYGWLETGRIARDRMPQVIRYFKDVSTPNDWGLEDWPDWIQTAPLANPPVDNVNLQAALAHLHQMIAEADSLTAQERDLLRIFRILTPQAQRQLMQVAQILRA